MSGLLRYQIFLEAVLFFLSVWYAALYLKDHGPLVAYAPIWAILLLGLYALGTIGLGLLNFKDCPEAAAEIEQQVKEAKVEMKKRGVNVK